MSEPETYEPTRIRRLYVRGYRSIRELTLEDLPPIVVLHGKNGTGKSNILRSMGLLLRWLSSDMAIADRREEAARLDYVTADAQLGIRKDDFHRHGGHEMQLAMEIELGSRARKSVDGLPAGGVLDINVVVHDVGDGIRWWASSAGLNETLSLMGSEARRIASARESHRREAAELKRLQTTLQELRDRLRSTSLTAAQRAQLAAEVSEKDAQAREIRSGIDTGERALSGVALTLDRLRSRLLRRDLLHFSDAYRRIGREPIGGSSEFDIDPMSLDSKDQIQRRLFLLATSSDPRERAVPRLLAARLEEALRQPGDPRPPPADPRPPIELNAVRNNEFREYETQITRGDLEAIPLTSLGTGEQQLLILLLDVLVAGTPIVQIEEPEAHLHKTTMLALAGMLEKVVTKHDVDQLFIATHHHAFAIAPTYYDVTCDDEHGTRATPTNRAKAIQHFYEPGPLWDALRSLVESGLRDDAILFRDKSGAPIRAKQVLASIQEEGSLAREFAEEMTKTILLSMREEAESDPS